MPAELLLPAWPVFPSFPVSVVTQESGVTNKFRSQNGVCPKEFSPRFLLHQNSPIPETATCDEQQWGLRLNAPDG
jgi:hypothetical protein